MKRRKGKKSFPPFRFLLCPFLIFISEEVEGSAEEKKKEPVDKFRFFYETGQAD